VPPNIAVQAAESAGLIDQVSLWVVTSAVQHCAEFQKIVPDFSVSINISPSNLRESDLPFYIDRALRTWGVNGRGLVVEITETAMMVDPKKARDALLELKSYGVRLSVDDFGTGYSSIYYLAQLPLDELKIDLMFVKSMLELPHYAKIVRSLIDLAHNLELMVVAEGVENEPIQDALQHLGCDYLQGYHIGRPVPAEDLKARLRAQHDAQ
jgi:EAL domain-containing protein (putative c-di-GMP-specific phosphodiesterase class I)